MQNHRPPSFFLTNTIPLAPCTLAWTDSARLQHLPQMIVNLLVQRWGNLSKSFFKGSIICHFYHVFGRVGTAQFCRVQWKHVMILSQEPAGSICQLWGQESNPLKSISSNSFPYLCLTVNLGVWGSWGSSAPSCNWASIGGSGTRSTATALATRFSFGGSLGKPHCSLPPWLPSYFLASALCRCFVQWGPAAKSHLQSICLGSWHWYILQCRPLPILLAPCGRRRLPQSLHFGWTLPDRSHLSWTPPQCHHLF